MDKTETYIRMCKKAEEIQEEWQPKLGDWCISPQEIVELVTKSAIEVDTPQSFGKPEYLTIQIATTFGKGGELQNTHPDWKGHKSLRRYIWLPRQDDLQKMIEGDWLEKLQELMLPKEAWLRPSILSGFTSMEQLWLAFVMKRKYNKVWNGNNWIEG